MIQSRSGNSDARHKQLIYIRALNTIPMLTVHYGQFRNRRISRPLAIPVQGFPRYVEICSTEEKGTDVNLASYLLVDGVDGDYEQAIVISNDADLALPIGMVRGKLRFPVGIVNPGPKAHTPEELTKAATFVRRLRSTTLSACQFPRQLRDSTGVITKLSSQAVELVAANVRRRVCYNPSRRTSSSSVTIAPVRPRASWAAR